jgi:hypothetical protein
MTIVSDYLFVTFTWLSDVNSNGCLYEFTYKASSVSKYSPNIYSFPSKPPLDTSVTTNPDYKNSTMLRILLLFIIQTVLIAQAGVIPNAVFVDR